MTLNSDYSAGSQTALEQEQQVVAVIDALTAGDLLVEAETSSPIGRALQKLVNKLRHASGGDLNRIVELSICSNENSISSARLLYNLQSADDEARCIAASAEQLQSSIHAIRAHSQTMREGNNASISMVDTVANSLQTSVSAFEKIRASVVESSAQFGEMSGFANEIRKIAEAIKGIAFQTNLLALNASVEAARAGAVGAGFAVVAQEMRSLANSSADATKLITNLVDSFDDQMVSVTKALDSSIHNVDEGKVSIETVDSQMLTMKRNIAQSSESILQISHAIEEQSSAASNVSDGIAQVAQSTSVSVDSTGEILDSITVLQGHINQQIEELGALNLPNKIIKLAQSDHVIWKKRLVNMVCGKEGLNAQELADHHSCRLGKWYDKVTDPKLRNNPLFKQLLTPHEQVHSHGKRAVQFFNQGNTGEALREINAVEEASVDVLRLLKQLEKH